MKTIHVECKVSNDEAKNHLRVLMIHISSWFDYVETRSEYELSHAHYLQTLNEFRTSIGDHAIMEVEKIVKNITQKEKHLFHYNFRGNARSVLKEILFASLVFQV